MSRLYRAAVCLTDKNMLAYCMANARATGRLEYIPKRAHSDGDVILDQAWHICVGRIGGSMHERGIIHATPVIL